ncbi:MAG TPA: hypothetical protein VHZ09_04930 [Acidobacteriaceae bacterium]|jgi:ureidoglycolate hydrolase|nr:hypothetical protein [Acidobacteriaceae bacterium]
MTQHKSHSAKESDHPQNQSGGREFGDVIDPTQAQMASENDGLTDNTTKPSAEKEPTTHRKKKNAA